MSTTHHNRPIGIFDSGIGGLTVFKAVRRALPGEDIVYFGDTAHLPYGNKSKETITRFSINNIDFLKRFDVKMVIVACNSASSLSLDAVKKKFSFPIIGVIEPGAKAALKKTMNNKIGVVGTKSTIGSAAYENSLKKMRPKIKVYSQACPLFVPLVEEGWLSGDVVEKTAKVYLDPLKNFGMDTLILGCTHYPLLTKIIQKVIGNKVKLVNSADETAHAAKELLEKKKLLSHKTKKIGSTRFYVSDEPESFRVLGERFLGESITSVAKIDENV